VTPRDEESVRAAVAGAARIMSRLELVTAFGHVSARSDDVVYVTPAADLAEVDAAGIVPVPLTATALPATAPAEAWLHLAVYRARPDVRSVARAQPESTFPVGALARELVPVHGQAAWLGRRVPVHQGARLLRSVELAVPAAESLGDGDAMLLRANGGVTVGDSPGAAVARMWLLDRACRVWLGTSGPGPVAVLDDDEIASWRSAGPDLLDRLWTHLCRVAGVPR
jgi:HCOMODA/2-hydroxy-3-carboxy-muconic semialdehyde decarboxylase